jgi:polysaccharide biosynthesis/export protein
VSLRCKSARLGALGAVVLLVSVGGCAVVPDGGPGWRDVNSNATATIASDTPVFAYALVDLNSSVLPYIVDPGPGSLFRTFGTGRGPAPEIKVGIGDTVQVTLFEAQAGGLFVPLDAGARPGNFVTLPAQTVDTKGYITVPYAGQVPALNRTTPAIQQAIVERLKNRAIEPQAIVAITNQTSTEVTVVGEVNLPSKFPVNPAGDTVLDAISRAGGIKEQGYENYVSLVRRGLKGTVYFLNLVRDPKENVFVKPGDAVYVSFYQRSFLAFGATGVSGQFKFQQEELTLNDAVGKAGGLLDNRSDPRQVFVYRLESRIALEKMGADTSHFAPEKQLIPTIYRANFRDPSGFFASHKFPMRDGDILYVDNADQVELTKFLALVASVADTAGSVTNVAVNVAAAKAAVHYVQH